MMTQLIKAALLSFIILTCFSFKAEAITVSGNGSFDITYIVPKGSVGENGTLPFDLIGHSTWSVSNFSSKGFNLSITMKNDTVVDSSYVPKDARITAFGFDIDQDMDVSNFQKGSSFLYYGTNTILPSFGTVDMCIFGGSNCAGGSNGGLYAGSSDKVSFRLDLADCNDSVKNFNLTTFGMKWQTKWGSFELAGCEGKSCDSTPPTSPSPEPGSVLLIFGGLGLMLALKRRQSF